MKAGRSRALKTEAHLQAIALWYRVYGVLFGALFLLALLLMVRVGVDPLRIGIVGACIAPCILSYVLGRLLKRYSNVARVVAGILAAIAAVSTAISAVPPEDTFTLLAAAGLVVYYGAATWVLFSRRARRICSERYAELVARSAFVKPKMFNSPFFWIPMILILLVLWLMLAAMLLLAA